MTASVKDNRPVPVQQDAVLGMPLHGLGERAALHVPAHLDELLRRAPVVHPDDFLLDDRSLVQGGGDVVRRGADQLHTAGMGLVVRLGALEGGQERVVDVDGLAGQLGAQLIGEDLHVAGQDGQLDVVLLHQGAQRILGLGLGVRGDRDVVERDAVELRQALEVTVVGHDGRDLDRQRAGALQEQQVVQAVRRGAGHQQGPDLASCRVEAPLHPEGLRHGLQRRLQLRLGGRRRRLDPHEKGAGALAAVLLGVRNVAARHQEGAGDGVHDSGPVGAGKGQDVGSSQLLVSHGDQPTRARLAAVW